MSILIKGMEMPKSCDVCPFMFHERRQPEVWCTVIEDNWLDLRETLCDERHQNCPFVEIPPHGRLIDADEFLKRAIGTKCFRGDYALMLEELVGESTTIIPAEEET